MRLIDKIRAITPATLIQALRNVIAIVYTLYQVLMFLYRLTRNGGK